MNIKRIFRLTFACCVSSALFSLSLISFHADISLAALPLSLVFVAALAFFSIKKLFAERNLAFIAVFRELLQYLPYILLVSFVLRRAGEEGTPYAIDFLSVLLWIVSSALSLVILYFLNPKRIGKVSKDWHTYIEEKKAERKNPAQKSFVNSTVREALSWIDALVQAVFMVLLLNVFIVQLYEIPSESMVPEFLIKDRVVVFKTLSAPKFPLSDVGLPYIKKYNRGDIVVFRNPHYANDRKSEVRTFISQLVYMCTLTKVNLNVDENGNQKADPLVKRVCGVEGEQLMMQDGILYSRTKDSPEFKPVELDSTWATWNLNAVKPSLKKGIRDFPLSENDYASMLSVEDERRNLNLGELAVECKKIASDFDSLYRKSSNVKSGKLNLNDEQMSVYSLFINSGYFTASLLSTENGSEWFSAFMTDWCDKIPDFKGDFYSEANYRLNLMIKRLSGKMILRNAQLFLSGSDVSSWQHDSEQNENLVEAQKLYTYVMLLDLRNMPIFPANADDGSPRYIPENCYFMMGDNRFNSLDMRHSYERWNAKLSPADNYSATYVSDMSPQYVNRSRMLGTTSYRFWPVSRAGVPKLTGR
ncbi:signal peptidase I [uncultured Treponema sp.]|uniref:signal peptidase I n=1 Tax=uncultured Treponema sp. TaxID=162155 RepID=UPI0025E25210|nr:signal peptidase I [uncultured Treponema sp.]